MAKLSSQGSPKDTISWYPKSKILRICDFKEPKVGGNREQRISRLGLSHAFGQRPGEFLVHSAREGALYFWTLGKERGSYFRYTR